MTHSEAQALITPYLDHELASADATALLEHCSTCEICNARLQEFSAVKLTTKQMMPKFSAPAELKEQFGVSEALPRKLKWQMPIIRWGVPLVTSFTLGMLAMMFLTRAHSSSDSLADEIVDVASSDKHTVKPWFAGKTDFSPTVTDLAPEGYPLLGGRAAHLDGTDVAALIYSHGKHYIALYQWIAKTKPVKKEQTIRGYHTLSFTSGEITFVAVSDASVEELENFKMALLKN
jgi:anti-sigma factor RsiW